MLRVTVELVPFGDEDHPYKQFLGQMLVFNEGKISDITRLNPDYSDYQAVLLDDIGTRSTTLVHERGKGWERLVGRALFGIGTARYDREVKDEERVTRIRTEGS